MCPLPDLLKERRHRFVMFVLGHVTKTQREEPAVSFCLGSSVNDAADGSVRSRPLDRCFNGVYPVRRRPPRDGQTCCLRSFRPLFHLSHPSCHTWFILRSQELKPHTIKNTFNKKKKKEKSIDFNKIACLLVRMLFDTNINSYKVKYCQFWPK